MYANENTYQILIVQKLSQYNTITYLAHHFLNHTEMTKEK